jgi:hypothetical protein
VLCAAAAMVLMEDGHCVVGPAPDIHAPLQQGALEPAYSGGAPQTLSPPSNRLRDPAWRCPQARECTSHCRACLNPPGRRCQVMLLPASSQGHACQ